MGFYFSYEFEFHLYDWDAAKKFLKKIENIIENDKDDDDDNDNKFRISIAGKGEASMDIKVGIYLGESKSFLIGFSVGINGLLGSGEIGFALQYNFNKGIIELDNYYIIKAFGLRFFLKIEIKIEMIISIQFEIYIFNVNLFGLKYEKHKLKKIS